MEHVIKEITTPYVFLLIAIGMLLIGRIVFKKSYLNIIDIITKHLECYKKHNGKYSFVSLILYYGVPVLIACSLIQIKQLDENVVNILTNKQK